MIKVLNSHINNDFDLNNKGFSNANDNKQLPRHRWYCYKEGFSPSLVCSAIKAYNLNSKSLIVDPFNGSGTVTLTASENCIPSIGLEVNPFTAFVAKTKELNTKSKVINRLFEETLSKLHNGDFTNSLEVFSTFTPLTGKKKWLFNLSVLRSYFRGLNHLKTINSNASSILKIALINAAMENSNAKKDGKCLRYKNQWESLGYSKHTFIESFKQIYEKIVIDINNSKLITHSKIIHTDSRKFNEIPSKNFDLVVTSPPYMNTFDYTDIYRPELFLGGFVKNKRELYNLRLKTVRSHIQANWKKPDFGNIESIILKEYYTHLISHKDKLMHDRIPDMVLAYFEDMASVFEQLSKKANKDAHMWMVVSNSAYANEEIPVDLILADIASNNGWLLEEVGVLRHISKRKTKYSPDVSKLRESVIILKAR